MGTAYIFQIMKKPITEAIGKEIAIMAKSKLMIQKFLNIQLISCPNMKKNNN